MTFLSSLLKQKVKPRFVSILLYVVVILSLHRILSLTSFETSNYLQIDNPRSFLVSITGGGNVNGRGIVGNGSTYFASISVSDEASGKKRESTKPRIETNMSSSSQTFAGKSSNNIIDRGDLIIWRKRRSTGWELFDGWHVKEDGGERVLLPENADGGSTGGGPILDFFIAAFPKCGTTALMRTLAAVTTMPPEADIFTPPHKTVYYAYNNWADQFGNGAGNYTDTKPLKGSKCPMTLEGPDLDSIGRQLPKTNLIVGIRHPVHWFQSFVNMRWFWIKSHSPVNLDGYVHSILLNSTLSTDNHKCKNVKEKVCVARSRFHLSLARLGKTPLDQTERDLLQSELYQTKLRRNDTSTILRKYPVKNKEGVPNKVFLFESGQGKEEYFYKELAEFVNIDPSMLPPINFKTGNGLNKKNYQDLQKKSSSSTFVYQNLIRLGKKSCRFRMFSERGSCSI